MQIDYIRRDTPESFSEDGGAFIQIVNKKTVGLASSIEEARASLHVVGSAPLIEGYFVGIMRSVFEGIREDGHPRTVGDVTFFPVCGGQFDLDKGWDPAVNDVRIKARLLNGVTLDISDWTFRDVTEGRVAFAIDTVSDGSVEGRVSTDCDVELNGRGLPAKEKLSVSWACGTKSGKVAADKFTVNCSRITVDKSALAALTAAEDGQDITIAVKGCYNKATKTAVVKHVAAPAPIYTSDLGGLKVMTGTDSHEHTLPTGPVAVSATTDTLVLTGNGLVQTSSTAPTTGFTDVFAQGVGGSNIPITPVVDAENHRLTLPLGTAFASVAAGTYENAKLVFFCYTGGQEDSLEIPIKVIKG